MLVLASPQILEKTDNILLRSLILFSHRALEVRSNIAGSKGPVHPSVPLSFSFHWEDYRASHSIMSFLVRTDQSIAEFARLTSHLSEEFFIVKLRNYWIGESSILLKDRICHFINWLERKQVAINMVNVLPKRNKLTTPNCRASGENTAIMKVSRII